MAGLSHGRAAARRPRPRAESAPRRRRLRPSASASARLLAGLRLRRPGDGGVGRAPTARRRRGGLVERGLEQAAVEPLARSTRGPAASPAARRRRRSRAGRPSRARRSAIRYWAEVLPVALSKRDDPVGSAGRRRTACPRRGVGRRDERGTTGIGPEELVGRRRRGAQSLPRPAMKRATIAVRRRRRSRRRCTSTVMPSTGPAAVVQVAGCRPPGSRTRRWPASSAGSAARTGRRRTGCRARVGVRARRSPISMMSAPQVDDLGDPDPGQRPVALVVGRPPAPEDVLVVEDQDVGAARRRGSRGRRPWSPRAAGPGPDDSAAFLAARSIR